MKELENYTDPQSLTIEEIREGVGGYSTDIQDIPYSETKKTLTGLNSTFNQNEPHHLYPVAPLFHKFGREFGGTWRETTSRLNGPRKNNYFHFYALTTRSRGSVIVGEQIEIEAALIYLQARKDILDSRGTTSAKISDITSLARERLGNYFASIPLLEPTSKAPAYVKKKIESKEIPLAEQYDEEEEESEEEELIAAESLKKIQRYLIKIPEPTDNQLKLYSAVDEVWLTNAINNIEREKKRLQGIVFGDISYARVGIPPEIGRIASFISHVSERRLDEFDKSLEKQTYQELVSGLLKCLKYVKGNEEIGNLANLFLRVRGIVEDNPESFFKKKE